MYQALQSKRHLQVKELLKENPDLATELCEGKNVLTIAIEKRDYKMVALLLKFGADPTQASWDDIRPIDFTIKAKRPHKYVQIMLTESSNSEDVLEREPYRKIKIRVLKKTEKWENDIKFRYQILKKLLKKYPKSDTVYRLLRSGANLTFKQKDKLFLFSLSNKVISNIKYLLNNGADPNAILSDDDGDVSALVLALYYKQPLEVFKLMIDKGLNLLQVNSGADFLKRESIKGELTLSQFKENTVKDISILNFLIIFNVQNEILDLFMESKISLFFLDSLGRNSLLYSLEIRKNLKIAKKILDRYLQIVNNVNKNKNNLKNNTQNEIEKEDDIENSDNNNNNKCSNGNSNGSNVDRDVNGEDINVLSDNSKVYNYLILSLRHLDTNISKLLLLAGADPNLMDRNGVSAIVWAMYYKKPPDLIQLMIEKGLDLNQVFQGKSYLDYSDNKIERRFFRHINSTFKQISHLSILHYAIFLQIPIESFKVLIKAGAPLWVADQNGTYPFEINVKYSPTKSEYALLILKASDQIPKRVLIQRYLLGCLKRAVSFDVIKLMIEKGARLNVMKGLNSFASIINVNNIQLSTLKGILKLDYGTLPLYKKCLPLYYACRLSDGYSIKILLRFGADPEMINPKTNAKPKEHLDNKNLKETIRIYGDYVNNYIKLYTRQENCDVTIVSSDNKKVYFHKLMFQCRLGGLVDYELFINTLKNFEKREIDLMMKWVYGGTCNDENKTLLTFLISALNLPEEIFKEKSFKRGLKRDLADLYNDNDSKDFILVVSELNKKEEVVEKEIPVHRLVLIANSELFREMLVNVDQESNRVHDYTGRSYEAIFYLIKYYYTDQLDEKISSKALDELYYAEEFYQLSEYNSLFPRICILKRKRKKRKTSKK
ncbi:ankyrin repeat-containing protein [Anaeramoeba flamelloides]|uniref:Ankyrin repeat-containing protein n=1 Tax=Anaeramoeba flamelloides TaxID=1746091 RepID=A0AAV7YTC8_9EUKA|nr:ankyrin repeat-containing protein [Anaeramoeba flamelloides]